jgi:hypothetical protein
MAAATGTAISMAAITTTTIMGITAAITVITEATMAVGIMAATTEVVTMAVGIMAVDTMAVTMEDITAGTTTDVAGAAPRRPSPGRAA